MTESEPRVAGLLLAAGGSSRLGRPKQLVEFEGKTLLRRAAEALVEAGCFPVIVVLGAEVEGARRELEGLFVDVVENQDWQSGMSSSISSGTNRLLEVESTAEAVLITLCDQPNVTGEHLRKLVERFSATRVAIIAAEYHGVAGVPALFSKNMFPQLQRLKGDKGARELIRNSPDAVTIPLPEAAIDIDGTKDLERLDRMSD